MKLLKVLFFSGLFLLTSTITFAQGPKTFSQSNDLFFEELADFFSTSSKSGDLKKFHKQLEKFWYSGAIPAEEQKNIIDRCNNLKKRYGKPYPHFHTYFTAIQLFFEQEHDMDSYHEWDKALDYLIMSKGMTKTLRFMDGTITLLRDKELFSSNTATWRAARLKSFSYEFGDDKVVKITFPPTDLVCSAAKNEFVLYQASGYYLPFENIWIGNKGKVTWERSGFDSEQVFAELSDYEIDFSKNGYSADSVWFTNKRYYTEGRMLGKLSDKTVAVRKGLEDKVAYPKFESYQQIYEMKDIYPGIDYKGGFTMAGSRFIGSGTVENPATLRFMRADSAIVFAKSEKYIFKEVLRNQNSKDKDPTKENVIISRNTEVSIYIQKDSIYHPGLLFKYEVEKNKLSLIRNDDAENMSRSPYFNSYHMIDMEFPQLTWIITETKMKMSGMEGSTVNKASFESADYFREARYNEIGGGDRTHPLIALKNLSLQMKQDHFTVSEFANYLRIPPINAVHLCLALSYRGLIRYDQDKQTVYLKERVFEYLDARVGKIDYDVIQFNSEHDAKNLANATLDLESFDLDILGVSKIQVSDSQNVVFKPRGGQLTMHKNRDFEFDGIIEAGLFTYYGRGFDFSYDNFKIGLKNVDSLKIKVESFEKNEYGIKPLRDIKNAIEYITGDILIDDPGNKSSIKDFPQYPIFNSKKPSYVYYDYPAIYGGVYDRKDFFFKVDPYSIDSINSFSTEGLFFNGEFKSADIFETMTEKIVVRPDYSFGFVRETGAAGYPVYKGKGKFTNTMDLSFKGLVGFGNIDYLNTHTTSEKGLTFFPDSTNGIADTYHISKQTKAQGTEYPEVNGENVYIHWEPYNDKWVSKETGKAFKMYGDTTYLTGQLVFTPKGLGGAGRYSFSDAVITSNDFSFLEKEVLSDMSTFDLISGDGAIKKFKTENVKTYVNFETKKANFKANGDSTIVEMPENKYVCYLTEFAWDMVKKEIALGNPKALEEENPTNGLFFRSRLMSQDTISFRAPYATYDTKNSIIDVYKVPHIDVADSRIFPNKDSIITIRKEAKMKTIRNATFLASRENKYHKIYDATFNINGKLDYSGNGSYDYIDETGQKQTLLFTFIGVDEEYRTYATGKIAETDEFTLSPEYKYYGDVRMNAWRKDLTFDGTAIIANECGVIEPQWFKFKSEIDPLSIYIPLSTDPLSRNDDTLGTSIYIARYPSQFYTAFLSAKTDKRDVEVIDAQGFLHYDKDSRRYKIASKSKLMKEDTVGNILTYHREFCNSYGEGNINFGVDLGQVKTSAVGTINHNIQSDRVTLETVTTVDFMFDGGIMKGIADTIANRTTLKPVDMASKAFKQASVQMLGVDQAKVLDDEMQLFGKWKKFPPQFEHTFTFSYLDLVWDTAAYCYRSVGQLGILTIDGREVNKMVKGFVEIAKHYKGDMITIYLDLGDRWYFFHYDTEIMQFISSDPAANLALDAIKEPKRTLSVSKKEAQYKYQLSSEAAKNIFVTRFNNKDPYPNIAPPTMFAAEADDYDDSGSGDGKGKVEGATPNKEEAPVEKPKNADGYDDYED